MLLEESKFATPLVEHAHLSAARCPHVNTTALVFIFLPRISLFYVMTHAPGGAPKPFMRIPWLAVNYVVTVEVAPALNALIAVAGSLSGDARLALRAWAVLGVDGEGRPGLRLVERTCCQRVSRLQLSAEAAVVYKEPAWAQLWHGGTPAATSGSRRGALSGSTARLLQCFCGRSLADTKCSAWLWLVVRLQAALAPWFYTGVFAMVPHRGLASMYTCIQP